MGNGCLKNTVITVIYPIDSFNKDWTKEKMDKWVQTAGGRHTTKFTDNTTHIVCTQKAWKNKSGEVRAAVEAKKKGERIHIVSPDWLQDALFLQKRGKESHFSWEKMDTRAATAQKKAEKEAARIEKAEQGPRTGAGLLAQVFEEHTENALSEEEKKRLEKQLEKEKEARRQAAVEKEVEKQQQREMERKERKEQEAIFRKGAKKAKNQIFSDNHHIYMDATGFKYEVTLTKVDTKANRNERFTLTLKLYESNSEPATYATNLHFGGTGKLPSNNVVAAIGCNYPTAFHAFRNTFKEKTKVEWNDRITFAVERARREKRARGEATNSPEGTERGAPVSETGLEEGLKAMEEQDFQRRPFMYHPPLYGARGLLPEKAKEVFPEVGPPLIQESEDRRRKAGEIEVWMSGANGSGTSPEGHDIAQTAKTPASNANGATTSGEKTHFDEFMEGAAAAAANGGETQGAEMEFDFGDKLDDTYYPFGEGEFQEVNFGAAEDAKEEVVGAEPNADAAGAVVEQGMDVDQTEQALPETVPETQNDSFGHTQRAEDAARGLDDLMHEAEAAAIEAPAAEETTPAEDPMQVEMATEPAPKTTSKLGGTLNLGSSILGKRKSSPADSAMASPAKKPDLNRVEAFVDAPESFEEGSYQLENQEKASGGATPRAVEEDEFAAQEQMEMEMFGFSSGDLEI